MGRGEAGDGVEFGELAVVVGRGEGEELLLGLLAEVARVDEEEDAADAGVLEQAVDRRDGGERFSRAGGHLDEGAGAGILKGDIEIGDRLDLAVAQAGGIEHGQVV